MKTKTKKPSRASIIRNEKANKNSQILNAQIKLHMLWNTVGSEAFKQTKMVIELAENMEDKISYIEHQYPLGFQTALENIGRSYESNQQDGETQAGMEEILIKIKEVADYFKKLPYSTIPKEGI